MSLRVYKLGVENELRFIVCEGTTVSVELLSGFAEIFGSELALNTVYTFQPHTSISLFTWQGCEVKITGNVRNLYIEKDSLIMISVNIHACLEEQRIMAESSSRKGPVSLVVGSMQSGKSTFCHFLLNYAARMGRKPLYVDLDMFQNRSSMPGTVSLFPVETPFHASEGFSKQDLSVYLFGYTHPRENKKMYFLLIKQLAEIVKNRLTKENSDSYHSGVIIDAFNWWHREGYDAIVLATRVFEPDVIFVISATPLFLKLRNVVPSNVEVVFVPKQTNRTSYVYKRIYKEQMRENLIRRYFYGSIQFPLFPNKFDVAFSELQIYSVCTFLNAGATLTDLCNVSIKDVDVVNVQIAPNLVNSILGMSYACKLDDDILVTKVKSFICVVAVNMEKGVVTVLSPEPAPMPSKIFILSSLKFKNIRR